MAERPLPNWDVAEIRRRLGLVANFATVAEADYGHPRVRVRLTPDGAEKELVSDWLPWITARAQNDRTWHPPEVGEQVFVVAPYGDLNQACVLGAVFAQDAEARRQPADRPTVDRTVYSDGAVIEYDRGNGLLRANIPGDATLAAGGRIDATADSDIKAVAGGNATVNASGDITLDATTVQINADVNVSGKMTVQQDIVGGAQGISLTQHHHTDVEPGTGETGDPVNG